MTETAFVVIRAIVNERFQPELMRSSREHIASLFFCVSSDSRAPRKLECNC